MTAEHSEETSYICFKWSAKTFHFGKLWSLCGKTFSKYWFCHCSFTAYRSACYFIFIVMSLNSWLV